MTEPTWQHHEIEPGKVRLMVEHHARGLARDVLQCDRDIALPIRAGKTTMPAFMTPPPAPSPSGRGPG